MFDKNEEPDFQQYKKLSIYQKAMEIVELVDAMVALIPEEDEMLQDVKRQMLMDAYQIPAKIAGAEGGNLYDIRMENAAIIRKAARELVTQTHALEMFGFEEEEYFQLLRQEVEAFRVLFVEWVESFDPWNYIIDRWGLFNPPGKTAHDKDPDDDLPFDPDDRF